MIFARLRNTLRTDLRGDTWRGAMVRSAGITAGLKVGATATAFGARLLYARALGPHGWAVCVCRRGTMVLGTSGIAPAQPC